MKFQIRNTLASDIALYKQCIDNEEFRLNLYGVNTVNLEELISIDIQQKKYVISKFNNNKMEHVGFCHFYYNHEIEEYIYSGGLLPEFFNSGIGLYASVAVLSYMFNSNPIIVINTAVYKYNQRSLRMLLATGFQFFMEQNNKIILKIIIKHFDNQFVNKILERLEISTMLL